MIMMIKLKKKKENVVSSTFIYNGKLYSKNFSHISFIYESKSLERLI